MDMDAFVESGLLEDESVNFCCTYAINIIHNNICDDHP